MTREQAKQVVKELHDVLIRHRVLYDDDKHAGICLAEWVVEGPPPNPFTSVQFITEGEWRLLGDE